MLINVLKGLNFEWPWKKVINYKLNKSLVSFVKEIFQYSVHLKKNTSRKEFFKGISPRGEDLKIK